MAQPRHPPDEDNPPLENNNGVTTKFRAGIKSFFLTFPQGFGPPVTFRGRPTILFNCSVQLLTSASKVTKES